MCIILLFCAERKKRELVKLREISFPSISVVIPTLNSSTTLSQCLSSIASQTYPGSIEIIVADGGSADDTIKIAEDFGCVVISNPLKTGEAGKAAGIKKARGEIIALIDSDNILPESDWLVRMVRPFENPLIVAAEPIEYTYRRSDGTLTRYCALMGMNDPLCYFLGNYDRYCVLSGKWTGLDIRSRDSGDFLEIELEEGKIPTIGANGFMVRKEALKILQPRDYLFDVDMVAELVRSGMRKFAKVKIGIVHLYGKGLISFTRKQLRRIRDFQYFKSIGLRTYEWTEGRKKGITKFILSCVTILPLIFQMIKGYSRKKDLAWSYHLPACLVTLVVYTYGYIEGIIRPRAHKRSSWYQSG